MGMRKEHEVPNGTLLVCRGDAICSGCAYEKRIAELESDRSRAWETAHKAVERGMGLEATLAALKEAAKNRLKHGHHIFCMSGVRPTKGVLADIEPPEKYACDCGHDKLAALLQEKGE